MTNKQKCESFRAFIVLQGLKESFYTKMGLKDNYGFKKAKSVNFHKIGLKMGLQGFIWAKYVHYGKNGFSLSHSQFSRA